MIRLVVLPSLWVVSVLSWCRIITYEGYNCGGNLLGLHHTEVPGRVALYPGTNRNDDREDEKTRSFFVQGDCHKILIVPSEVSGRQVSDYLNFDGLTIKNEFMFSVPGFGNEDEGEGVAKLGYEDKGRLWQKCHDLNDLEFYSWKIGAFVLVALDYHDPKYNWHVITEDWFPDIKNCGNMDYEWTKTVDEYYASRRCGGPGSAPPTFIEQLRSIRDDIRSLCIVDAGYDNRRDCDPEKNPPPVAGAILAYAENEYKSVCLGIYRVGELSECTLSYAPIGQRLINLQDKVYSLCLKIYGQSGPSRCRKALPLDKQYHIHYQCWREWECRYSLDQWPGEENVHAPGFGWRVRGAIMSG